MMRRNHLAVVVFVGLAAGLGAACSDATSPDTQAPLSDSLVSADVAATAGDAIASDVDNMVANETSVGFDMS
ncbi:MAG TPA: hypothetical protein VGI83_04480, partial [Gemmatimonadales bacterium]